MPNPSEIVGFPGGPGDATCPGVAQSTSTFKQLAAWSKSVDAVVSLYAASARFPADERYGLTSQIKRAAVSIPANIAEGNSGLSTRRYVQHVQIALGSLGELRALLEIAWRLKLLTDKERGPLEQQLDVVGRLLYGLRTALKQRLLAEEKKQQPNK